MSESNSLIERVCEHIRSVICNGSLLPGHRVNITALEAELVCSKSTIRMACHRLVGEGLLEVHTNDGFYRPIVTDVSVRSQYEFNLNVLLLGLDTAKPAALRIPPEASYRPVGDTIADTEQLFSAIAGLGENQISIRLIRILNAMLRPQRLRQFQLPVDSSTELQTLADAWAEQDYKDLRRLLIDYHNRRLNIISEIVMLAYRPGGTDDDSGRPST